MSTNPTPLMDARFACLVTGERSSDYKQHEGSPRFQCNK